MLKGLPASGKSTYAKELSKQGWKRVNKDDLRSMIDGGIWSKENEDIILLVRDNIINISLHRGFNVVVDDTNFSPEHEKNLRSLSEVHGAEFKVKLFDVPLKECIERDAKRTIGHVGKKVIIDMYNKYLKKEPTYIPLNENLPNCYIFDIDGTLAKMGDRKFYEWKKVGLDTPNDPVISLYNNLRKSSATATFIILSGRDEECRPETEEWLRKNVGFYDVLLMRPKGDMRKDFIVKNEIYDAHIKDKYNVLAIFDDRNQVVELWRSLGLPCLQVADGDF